MSSSCYFAFTPREWARLHSLVAPITLSEAEADLAQLEEENGGLVALAEVAEVYLPLAQFIHLQAVAAQARHRETWARLGNAFPRIPYIVGIAGGVAVGKSTIAHLLRAHLGRRPEHYRVDVVTTDGFLHPNRVLQARDLMQRKGFPETYDCQHLARFLADVRSGCAKAAAPLYSHLSYDVLQDAVQVVRRPDILIVEGLNVLQVCSAAPGHDRHAVFSDFIDLALYVDAAEEDIRHWYVQRFLALRARAFTHPEGSFFRRYVDLSPDKAVKEATRIWTDINAVNLREHIHPTRWRAHAILEKGADHAVRCVKLRRY